jgi:hypothetical protein
MKCVPVLPIAALLAATGVATTASADPMRPSQDPTPQHQYPQASGRVSYVPDRLEVQAVHNFGACIVGYTPDGARRVLSLDYRSSDYERQLYALAKGHDDRCLLGGWRYKFAPSLVAGAMAEALLKSRVNSAELPKQLAFDPSRQPIEARGPLEEMALCAVMKDPQETVRIFGTEPATTAEAEAIRPMTGVLTKCLKKDTQVELNKPGIRALLALAAWRVINTPEGAAH